MRESPEELLRLQELIDRTHSRMNPHMPDIVTPERRLTARQVVTYLEGIKHVAFATVNGTAEIVGRDHPEIPALEPVYLDVYGSSPFSWGEGVVIVRVEPSSMWTFSFHPESYPE